MKRLNIKANKLNHQTAGAEISPCKLLKYLEVISMEKAYPVILTPSKTGYVVYVPDLKINTQGTDVANAIEMARDAIGLWGISEEDMEHSIPEPSSQFPKHSPDEIITLVDIDFDAYRRAHDNKTVRKNLTLPSWLNDRAEKAGVNFSAVLQSALKDYLEIHDKQPGEPE